MANILDIFRTHTGELLLQKTSELIPVEKKEIRQAFTFSLPAMLVILQDKPSFRTKTTAQDLISYIEGSDLISSGKEYLEEFIQEQQLESLSNNNIFTGLSSEQFHKLLSISAGVMAGIISQIQKTDAKARFSEIIETLSGYNAKYEKAFIKTLIKNEDDPNLIESSEEIALDHKKDDDDQSILGGYTGGR